MHSTRFFTNAMASLASSIQLGNVTFVRRAFELKWRLEPKWLRMMMMMTMMMMMMMMMLMVMMMVMMMMMILVLFEGSKTGRETPTT